MLKTEDNYKQSKKKRLQKTGRITLKLLNYILVKGLRLRERLISVRRHLVSLGMIFDLKTWIKGAKDR
jgi:hypothetical protein